MSGVFIDLEITRNFEFFVEGDRIIVWMEDVIGKGFCQEVKQKFPDVCEKVGCPFCSAIACLISKCLRRPVIIDYVDVAPRARATEVAFRVIR